MSETASGGRAQKLTVIKLNVVPVDKAADGAVNLQIASSAPLVRREPWSKRCKGRETVSSWEDYGEQLVRTSVSDDVLTLWQL